MSKQDKATYSVVKSCGTCKWFNWVPYPYIDGFCGEEMDDIVVQSHYVCKNWEIEEE